MNVTALSSALRLVILALFPVTSTNAAFVPTFTELAPPLVWILVTVLKIFVEVTVPEAVGPVIVSDKASLPELAGDAGLIFNSDDVSDLKEKMKELIQNHALREKLANNSKIRRDAFFGWDEYAKKLEELFEEIISGNI